MDFKGGAMKSKYKVVQFVFITVLIIIFVYNIVIYAISFIAFSPVFMPSKESVEKDLQHYKTELLDVVNYLGDHNDTFIYITDADETKTTYIKDHQIGIVESKIEDKKIIDAIDHIVDNGKFNVISGNSGHFIEFQKWATLDKSCGIVYSFTGEQPNIEFLTNLESLEEKGWYYYISDYNEYRRHQQSR
jgi:hypothetical protein